MMKDLELLTEAKHMIIKHLDHSEDTELKNAIYKKAIMDCVADINELYEKTYEEWRKQND